MKAIVTRKNEDGTFDEVGMRNRMVTAEYKTERRLLKSLKDLINIRIEIFYNNFYKDNPDKIIYQ